METPRRQRGNAGATSIQSLPERLLGLILTEVSRKSIGMMHATVCRKWADMSPGCAKAAAVEHRNDLPCLRAVPNLESLSLHSNPTDDSGLPIGYGFGFLKELADAVPSLGSLLSLEYKRCNDVEDEFFALVPALKALKLEVDNSVFGLPYGFTQLTRLEELEVRCSDAPFINHLPSDFGRLRLLRNLRLKCPVAELPKSFQKLRRLQVLDLEFWGSKSAPFAGLRPVFQLTSLEELRLNLPEDPREGEGEGEDRDKAWRKIPASLGKLKALRKLAVEGDYYIVPDSLGQLTELESLILHSKRDAYPQAVSALTGLRHLDLEGELVREVPESLSRLTSLTSMRLAGLFKAVPDFFGAFPELRTLAIRAPVVSLPRSLRQLSKLEILRVPLGKLGDLARSDEEHGEGIDEPPSEPASSESRARQMEDALRIPSIESLELSFAQETELGLPESIGALERLQRLKISCHDMSQYLPGDSLTQLPATLGSLRSLRALTIRNLGISSLPDSLGSLSSLRLLRLQRLPKLTAIPGSIGHLDALEDVCIEACLEIEQLPSSLGGLKNLTTLIVAQWWQGDAAKRPALKCLPGSLGDLPRLKTLVLGGLPELTALPESFSRLTSLEVSPLPSNSVLQYCLYDVVAACVSTLNA